MPRTGSVWNVISAIRLLRVNKFSSSQIGDLFKEDLHKKLLPSGQVIETPGDRGLIKDAFEKSLITEHAPDFIPKASSIFFGKTDRKRGDE